MAFFGGVRLFSPAADAEVDLAFEAVDPLDLYVDALADFVGLATLAGDEALAVGAEAVEVVVEGGDMDHAECHGVGDFDEQAVVFDVGDHGGEALLDGLFEFAFIELEELGLYGLALGIDAVTLGDTEVLADALEFGLGVFDVGHFGGAVDAVFAEIPVEDAVYDKVGVAANR